MSAKKIPRICRICSGKKYLINIFDEENEDLIEIIRVSANQEVRRDDPLPKQICLTCQQGLEVAYKLRKLGEANAKKFQDEIKKEEESIKKEVKAEDSDGDLDFEDNVDDEDYVCEVEDEDDEEAGGSELGNNNIGEEQDDLEKIEEDYAECTEVSVLEDPLDEEEPMELEQGCEKEEDPEQEEEDLQQEEEPEPDPEPTTTRVTRYSKSNHRNIPEGLTLRDVRYKSYAKPKNADDDTKNQNIVYTGEIKLDKLKDFHLRVCKPPTSYFKLLQKIKDGNKKIKCKACGLKYVSRETFVNHALLHTGERAYKCKLPNCSKDYRDWKGLLTHLTQHCTEKKYMCKTCGKGFDLQVNFENHTRRAHKIISEKVEEPKPKRPRIERPKIEKPKVKDPEEDYDDDAVYEGNLDSKLEMLEFHKKVNRNPVGWESMLKRIREGKVRYQCLTCDNKFIELNRFVNHTIKHTGEATFRCRLPDCNEAFGIWSMLETHISKIHCSGKDIVCEICEFPSKLLTSHHNHMKTHDESRKKTPTTPKPKEIKNVTEEPEPKEEDNEMFYGENPTIEDLAEFHRIHKNEAKTWRPLTEYFEKDGVKKYKCIACGFESLKRYDHVSHVLIHTGELPWNCRVPGCNLCFRDWKRLRKHLVKHSVQDFFCEYCGKHYRDKYDLNAHVAKHTMGKSRKCPHCSAFFKTSHELGKHKRLHKAGEVLKECEICDDKYLGSQLLRKHMIRDHGVQLQEARKKIYKHFVCKDCTTGFKDELAFEAHREICFAVFEKQLVCRFCSKKFDDVMTYQEHEENFHEDKWKEYLMEQMTSIFTELEENDEELPSALKVAELILDEATPLWRKSGRF